jgi:amidase
VQPLNELLAVDAAKRLAAREITSEQLVRACLERIDAREATVGAWIHLDPAAAIAQAKALDAGPVRGPLHGLPLGVKDIIDTVDMPTGCGSDIYAGQRPVADAACVALARAAGALVLGKTVTTEFAWRHAGKTANPRVTENAPPHTPGGSSSGSAAAVADRMVPFAFGTQTAGSIVRPASYCGVAGYKPTHGTLSRAGVKTLAESLDTVGALARSAADAALLVGALSGRRLLAAPLDRAPRIRLCRTHQWPSAQPEVEQALERAVRAASKAGADVADVELPKSFAGLLQAQMDVMGYEAYRALASERVHHGGRLSAKIQEQLAAAARIDALAYDEARALARGCRTMLGEVFGNADVLLVPSAPGEAPKGLSETGDPVFNRVWTLLGTPAISLPCSTGPNGLPVGVQLIGRRGEDARLLAAADWLERQLSAA